MNNYKNARKQVCELLGIEPQELSYVLYKKGINNFYKQFKIPKKDGTYREICSPDKKLKYIQKKLSKVLIKKQNEYNKANNIVLNISHGFVRDKSIITNSKIHRNKKILLNIDICNFFDSFHFGRVKGFLEKNNAFKYSNEVSTILSQLACYKGKLPQGSPSSPIIANLIFNIVDMRIIKISKKFGLDYTRYADDLSFSTNNKSFFKNNEQFIKDIKNILEISGFSINEKKLRVIYSSSRQEVTGLTVNKKLNVNKKFIMETRAMANNEYRNGSFLINGEEGTINQLEGRFSFINQLDKYNNNINFNNDKKNLNKKFMHGLNSREKQYQYFLFYKYFYNPEKPTIVTEGKTDILHLKAALLKYYKMFPNLISKKGENIELKIYFLKRSERLRYFLGVYPDGADTMKNIFNFYKGKNNCFNINEYLNKKREPNNVNLKRNPVILLLDNEQESSGKKPLKEFLKYSNLKLSKKETTIRIIDNLYLQTIPLLVNTKEMEIEDLYSDNVLLTKIGGKLFTKKEDYDNKLYFGKDYFSKQVYKNYKNIDFKNFLPLLNSINTIVSKN